RVFAFTGQASAGFSEVSYEVGDTLLFGRETTGLPPHVLADPRITGGVRIPMLEGIRSLNLSNSAAVAAYEACPQHDYRELPARWPLSETPVSRFTGSPETPMAP